MPNNFIDNDLMDDEDVQIVQHCRYQVDDGFAVTINKYSPQLMFSCQRHHVI